MPVVELSPALLVLTDAVAWFAVSLVAGYACHMVAIYMVIVHLWP